MSSQYLRDPISKLWVLTSLKLRTEFPEQANPHKVVWTQFSGALGILERFIKQMLNLPPGGSDYHSSKRDPQQVAPDAGLSLVNESQNVTLQGQAPCLYKSYSRSI